MAAERLKHLDKSAESACILHRCISYSIATDIEVLHVLALHEHAKCLDKCQRLHARRRWMSLVVSPSLVAIDAMHGPGTQRVLPNVATAHGDERLCWLSWLDRR